MLVPQHFVHNEPPRGKVAVDHQLRRLAQHDLGHFAVDPAAQVAPTGLALVVIVGVHDVIALVDLVQQLAYLVGGSLAVVIKAYDDISGTLVEACHQRGVLAEVFRQVHALHMGVRRHQLADGSDRIIGRTVVDQHDLVVVLGHRLHRCGQLLMHRRQRMLGAVARDHKRNFLHGFHPFIGDWPAHTRSGRRSRQVAASRPLAGGLRRRCRG